MVGDCQTCGGQVEITRKWTVKHHRRRVISPATFTTTNTQGDHHA